MNSLLNLLTFTNLVRVPLGARSPNCQKLQAMALGQRTMEPLRLKVSSESGKLVTHSLSLLQSTQELFDLVPVFAHDPSIAFIAH